ncbi:MAG: tRNA epoxyqueuosine(34) reductase QueG [Balneolaceae bacterium]|nr:tRNA epoxyqueuosine(34) reductase QueG [Balneolaceae bacterium]MBO6546353.1 tRNA epoxyqueuosine(34) reductase QueG [Balneolaceae bacterium]MBO6648712.1 tRNA epoxyqueuosine(34) reductase QueG [Balneolaceae bacterium]
MMNKQKYTSLIRNRALELGFDACGFAKAERLDTEAERLAKWLDEDRHGTMDWMANNFEKRVDPTLLVPDSKTVVSLLASYHHPKHNTQVGITDQPLIAKYAQGRDYHKVLKKKLKELFNFTSDLVGGIEGRFFTDSAPVLDKAWAVKAGLGWVGKNSNILNRNIGSWFFIAEMVIDLETEYDSPTTDHCGTCTACLDACPTNAIYEPYKVDATKCISYLTIEHKGAIDEQYHTDIQNWVFGCDICQDVCPWNSKAKLAQLFDLHPKERVLNANFEGLTESEFDSLFEGSAVRRTRFEGFSRNLEIVKGNLS